MAQAQARTRLTGDAMLSHVESMADASKTEMIRAAGYVRDDDKTEYTAFYEALIEAKGIPTNKPVDRPELTEDQQELWNHACNCMGNLDDDDMEMIWDDLQSMGIDSVDAFDESYAGSYDGWRPDEEFAQDIVDGMGEINEDSILYSYIDWQAFYDGCLRYDYPRLETRYSSHYFREL